MSWPNMDTCELRKRDVFTRQQAALEGVGLVNQAGKAPVVKLIKNDCVD